MKFQQHLYSQSFRQISSTNKRIRNYFHTFLSAQYWLLRQTLSFIRTRWFYVCTFVCVCFFLSCTTNLLTHVMVKANETGSLFRYIRVVVILSDFCCFSYLCAHRQSWIHAIFVDDRFVLKCRHISIQFFKKRKLCWSSSSTFFLLLGIRTYFFWTFSVFHLN